MNEEMYCDKCNGIIKFELSTDTIHYGKNVCSVCGKWFGWVKSPDNLGRRGAVSRYSISQIMVFRKFECKPFCFFCLRNSKELGSKETLTRDHIQEIDKGGKDVLENLQVLCSACHKLKNWARLYMNWHYLK